MSQYSIMLTLRHIAIPQFLLPSYSVFLKLLMSGGFFLTLKDRINVDNNGHHHVYLCTWLGMYMITAITNGSSKIWDFECHKYYHTVIDNGERFPILSHWDNLKLASSLHRVAQTQRTFNRMLTLIYQCGICLWKFIQGIGIGHR